MDLVDFKSPLKGEGKEHFRAFCERNKLDFEENFQNLTTWFESFPAKIHANAHERHCYMSWWDWLFLCPKSSTQKQGG